MSWVALGPGALVDPVGMDVSQIERRFPDVGRPADPNTHDLEGRVLQKESQRVRARISCSPLDHTKRRRHGVAVSLKSEEGWR